MAKIELLVKKEFKVKYLQVDAGVRYFEDAEVDGFQENGDSPRMPFIVENRWKPLIDVDSGTIVDWPSGMTASVHYKVCDDGSYYLLDVDKNVIASIESDYVPQCLRYYSDANSDYIILEINGEGKINGWKPMFDEFIVNNNSKLSK